MKKHIQDAHEEYDPTVEKMYQCGKCQHSFLNMKKLAFHIKVVHEAIKKTEICHLCGETFFRTSIKNHLKICEKVKFECEYCGKVFKSGEILSKHIEKSCEVLPRQSEECDICGITVSTYILNNFQFHEFFL